MPVDRSVAREHAHWLALVETSGTFLSLPILMEAFAGGLDKRGDDEERELRRRLRLAYDEWSNNQAGHVPDPAIHTQWLRFVLEEVLEMHTDALLEDQQIPTSLAYEAKEHGETLRPNLVISSPFEKRPRLLVQLYPCGQSLEKPLPGKYWKASPAMRMMELLRNTEPQGTRLGLVTNGRSWMLVDAPKHETTGFYTWDAEIWLEEPLSLRSFSTLLSMQRFFNVPEDQTLEALLTKSTARQQEVTNQLGEQVRRAVEMLVQTLDRLDKDSQRTLLRSISETRLYEAALTVMMRLVFLLSAEERHLLLLGTPLYDQYYAVSTLQKLLREQADQHGEEVLGLRHDAWSRLLAVFRLVYGGVEYADLRLPAYGGHLFDPDRYPFLEGRPPGTRWRETPAQPLAIDNRTVLHLLEALQYLQVRLPGGGTEPRRLSFRGLDIEQIGHVYEGLLDHTARRASTTILGLQGTSDTEPEATLEELEDQAAKGEEALLAFLHELTGKSVNSLAKNLNAQSIDALGRVSGNVALGRVSGDAALGRISGGAALGRVFLNMQGLSQPERSNLMGACDNNQELFTRILPFSGLLRRDTFNNFVLVTPGSVYVTHGHDRRSTGTHYTPRSLTEPLVQHALDPLVYLGPAEGLPRDQWQLRSATDILALKICDFAMGSGAFLVQTCRYLAEKLVEAWENAEQALPKHGPRPRIIPTGQPSSGAPDEELLPLDGAERLAYARRLVAERCLYGVDKNPMAVEMAKLSLWLITLAKNKPFTFLDHALRCGDSLLGVNERQLRNWSMDAQPGEITQMVWMQDTVGRALSTALKLRRQIESLPEHDVRDIEQKERLLTEAEDAMQIVRLGADLLIAITLSDPKRRANLQDTLGNTYFLLAKAYEESHYAHFTTSGQAASREQFTALRTDVDTLLHSRRPFHWFLEFPEVFAHGGDEAGFAAIVGNPPFQGGQKITGVLGEDYREYLIEYLANGRRGSADLCAYFFLKATKLVRHEGMSALLATNTIAQGDTREVGLDQIIAHGWSIPRALPSRAWPGEASLEVAHIWLSHSKWAGSFVLNDMTVQSIGTLLVVPGKASGKPYALAENAHKSFQGSIVLGMGFVLEPTDAQALIEKDPRNKNVLFPYLNGEDLNSRPDQLPSRWIINFHDWPLEQAETYTNCMQIVKEKVKPERDKNNRQVYRDRWWHHAEKRPALYSTIADMERALVKAQTSKTWGWVFVPNRMVYDQKLVVFAFDDDANLAILQSTVHWVWAIQYGSTLRLDMSYAPSDCFETFPFPTNTDSLESIGERYYQHRQSIMLARQEGLTKTYNRFHNPDEHAPDIVELRELHREMDEAVARAYGWEDLRLEHAFHETKQGLRYTISEAARREVLDRLLLLNHERHAQEVAAGLVDANGKPLKGKVPSKKNGASKGRIVEATPIEPLEDGLEQGSLF